VDFLASELLGAPERTIIADALTIAELLVKPFRDLSEAEAIEARWAFERVPGISIVPVGPDVAQLAAQVRARTGLKLPDAVHVAAAITGGAAAFLTNDARFKRASSFLPILVLDELLADPGASP
jgi:predicted nucleic acid-binding protein